MSDDLIRRAREALVDVTPGPWFPNYPDYHAGMVEVVGPAMRCVGFTIATDVDAEKAQRIKADARFIATARDLVPAMADRLEAQEALLREAMEVLLVAADELDWAGREIDEMLCVLSREPRGITGAVADQARATLAKLRSHMGETK